MDELETLLKEQLTVLNSIASSINAVKDGQDNLQKSIDTIQASGKGSKPKDDEEEEEEEDKDKKGVKAAVKAMDARLKTLETAVEDVTKDIEEMVKTIKLIGEKALGKEIDLEGDSKE